MNDFEPRLVEALQPVRHFFLAQAIEFGLTSGLLDELAADGTTGDRSSADVAKRLSMDPERLLGLLRYFAAEGIVRNPETSPRLTHKGEEARRFRPWYELLIGGYSATLGELPAVMADPRAYAGRNGGMVGLGSCGISRHDAIPLVRRLLALLPDTPGVVVDLGCGDGSFLLEICADRGPGIGIDPDASSIARARTLSREQGRGADVTFDVSTAQDFLSRTLDLPHRSVCFITAFSLQEVLEQRDRGAVVDLVRSALEQAPESYLIVVEVDHRPTDPAVMRHGLGLAYYNPYYLLHQVTEQRLETTEFWRDLFAEAGGSVVECLTTDPEVDSTGLELGFLVRKAG
ncbi:MULTISPECIES: 2-ketoarginine methyltransferase [Streptomyces]|uniref:2-ketoarginine methyltransferase n=1 Tax=Streptomyces lonegramiae TaxID=3075524 RepID=A0ABU2X742_9ACTN|nr:2-ketoarginine methyltransferase [Streptomyces sp. DSM 41529]MDT0541365.1 2-ketoarginine methyltransferase [Streptomyces sp. DSM 41529]